MFMFRISLKKLYYIRIFTEIKNLVVSSKVNVNSIEPKVLNGYCTKLQSNLEEEQSSSTGLNIVGKYRKDDKYNFCDAQSLHTKLGNYSIL